MTCWCEGKCPHIAKARELADQGRHPRAHAELRRILVVAPRCVEANLAIATILTKNNAAGAALVHVDRAAESGETFRTHLDRGVALRSQTKFVPAIGEFYEAMKLDPDNAIVAANLAAALEASGDLDNAQKVSDAARAKFPDDISVRRQAAVIADAQTDYGGALAILQSDNLSPLELLDRGRVKARIGDHAGAWDDWMAGKAIYRNNHGHRYDAQRFKQIFQALAAAGTPPRPSFTKAAPPLEMDPAPVFVTGFPRSGTTMIETVLGSHSAIVAGDELNGISDVIQALPRWLKVPMPYPAAMLATIQGESSEIPGLLRDLYYRGAQSRIGFVPTRRSAKSKVKFFTDKMPLNEMHIPLIRLLFPSAIVFHLQRHPLDVMVSCMSHWLVHGGFYASSLESCATHYLAIDQLLQGYKKAMPAEFGIKKFVPIGYENFITDQESHTRYMLARLGLDFEDRCLSFHENPRHSRTISYRQVKEPLHDKSVGRWKHYRDQLAPAVEILKPILERGGYES